MKLGLDDSYIIADDIGLTSNSIAELHIGDIIANSEGEFLYYQGNDVFLYVSNISGSYLINPYGPWHPLSSSKKIDTRTPIEKIKQWLSSIS
jgi:hypothetical protein